MIVVSTARKCRARSEKERGETRRREGGGVKSVDRKLHVLPSHKFSANVAAWREREREFPRHHATFRLATFRRDKRSLLITPRVLDARLIAGITGINARVCWQTRGMFVLRNKRTSVFRGGEENSAGY